MRVNSNSKLENSTNYGFVIESQSKLPYLENHLSYRNGSPIILSGRSGFYQVFLMFNRAKMSIQCVKTAKTKNNDSASFRKGSIVSKWPMISEISGYFYLPSMKLSQKRQIFRLEILPTFHKHHCRVFSNDKHFGQNCLFHFSLPILTFSYFFSVFTCFYPPKQ